MNGVKVHPPLYTKVMGRPKKNRRKTPEEKEKKKGTKILTRSGMTMHCSICETLTAIKRDITSGFLSSAICL
jgi:hypothetical protein